MDAIAEALRTFTIAAERRLRAKFTAGSPTQLSSAQFGKILHSPSMTEKALTPIFRADSNPRISSRFYRERRSVLLEGEGHEEVSTAHEHGDGYDRRCESRSG
jgi:hypothetical protein